MQSVPLKHLVLLSGLRVLAILGLLLAIGLGATHYLAKPVDADEVVAALYRDEGNPEAQLATDPMSVDRMEWEHIQKVLNDHDGNISAVARALKMHRRTLQRKLAKYPVKE